MQLRPAAAEVVRNARGIIVPEATLAREIGTHTGGTDYVGLIEKVLDKRVPASQYTSVYLANTPPTASQKKSLWAGVGRHADRQPDWPSHLHRGLRTLRHLGVADPGARAVWSAWRADWPNGTACTAYHSFG